MIRLEKVDRDLYELSMQGREDLLFEFEGDLEEAKAFVWRALIEGLACCEVVTEE